MYNSLSEQIHRLKSRLEYVNKTWTVSDYEGLLRFYVDILPKIMDSERCSIFIVNIGGKNVEVKFGTGLEEGQIEAPLDKSIVGESISKKQCIVENYLSSREGFHKEADAKTGFTTRNLICVPIKSLTEEAAIGAIEVLNKKGEGIFEESDKSILQEVSNYLSIAIENILINQEILHLSNQIEQQLERLTGKYLKSMHFVAQSKEIEDVLSRVYQISRTPVDVLLHGESGTGKELIARLIHQNSDRNQKPFVPVNCAAIPENLMESEFFGYERGAFTGAYTSRAGLFEQADSGTLFLDEVSEMPMSIQSKFLRVLQEKSGTRIGGNKTFEYDFRLISATNKDIFKEVQENRFRQDLFFRLFAVDILIPPLRQRVEDITPLALSFLNETSQRFNKRLAGFSPEVLAVFERYHWPGNVRQLRKEIERLAALTPDGERIELSSCSRELIEFEDSNPVDFEVDDGSLAEQLHKIEIKIVKDTLAKTNGNKSEAARILGITRQGLDKKLKRYSITSAKS